MLFEEKVRAFVTGVNTGRKEKSLTHAPFLLFLPSPPNLSTPPQDERLWMGIHKTDSGRFLVMNLGGKQQNESWVLDLLGRCSLPIPLSLPCPALPGTRMHVNYSLPMSIPTPQPISWTPACLPHHSQARRAGRSTWRGSCGSWRRGRRTCGTRWSTGARASSSSPTTSR